MADDAISPTTRDVACGIGACKPRVLRNWSNITAFTAVFGVAAMITSAMNTYIVSQVTTLEKLLGIESKESGFLLASPEIGFLAVVILSSHVTRKLHRPRVVGFLTLVYGVLVIACTVPHLIMLRYPSVFYRQSDAEDNYTLPTTPVCRDQRPHNHTHSHDDHHELRAYIQYISYSILVVSFVFQGAIKAPRIPIVSAFIDDHVPKTRTGVYFSAVVAIGIVGSLLAVGLGAVATSVYATLKETDMSRDNPNWLGAWWLGFVIVAAVSIVTTVPLCMFPKRLTSYRQSDESEVPRSPTLKTEIKDFPRAICQLTRNPVYVTIILGNCFNAMGVTGRLSYLPKYLEVHFRQQTSMATILFGVSTLAGAFMGVVTGGYVISKRKMSARASLKFGVVFGLVAIALLVPSSFLFCAQPQFRGFDLFRLKHSDEPPGDWSPIMGDNCYSNCSCKIGDYFPVCGDDGSNYFSPCFAGCKSSDDTDQVFTNCSCVDDHYHQHTSTTPGLCADQCPTLIPFLILEFGAAFFWLSTLIPKTVVQIRCVDVEDRSLSMGAGSFMHTIFGLLAPVIFGTLIDSSCILWDSGYCKLYDVTQLRHRYLFTSFGFVFLSSILYAISLAIVTYSHKYRDTMGADYDVLVEGRQCQGQPQATVSDDDVSRSVNEEEQKDATIQSEYSINLL